MVWALATSEKFLTPNRFADIREIPHAQEPVSITGKKGTVVFYSSHTPHAAQPFANKDTQRAVIFFSIGRRDTIAWTSTAKREADVARRLKTLFGKNDIKSSKSLRLAETPVTNFTHPPPLN